MNISVVERMDRGLAYGEGCFETFRVIGGHIFRRQAHMARLQLGLAEFGIVMDDEALDAIFGQAVEAASERGGDMLVRLTVSGGDAGWGLMPSAEVTPSVFVQVMPFTPPSGGVKLQSVVWPFAVNSKPAKFTADYAEALRAMRLWKSDGLNCEPLITADEKIISGLTANVLIFYEDRWHTPAIEQGGILPGIVRQYLLDAGIVHASSCPLNWLAGCEAMALCNSGRFIQPVASINGRDLNMADSLFAPLWQAFSGEAGVPEVSR